MKLPVKVISFVFLLWRWVVSSTLHNVRLIGECNLPISCRENPKRFSPIRIFIKSSFKDIFFLQGPIKAQEGQSLSGFCKIRLSLAKSNRNRFNLRSKISVEESGMCACRRVLILESSCQHRGILPSAFWVKFRKWHFRHHGRSYSASQTHWWLTQPLILMIVGMPPLRWI